ncbi:Asator [Strongyloides ratti]|uniref:Asator n=1 Tax=Strongyloides ratti TaxID=34506 RepID=A0A090MSN7_STRRB|nr:Asator [Strongyloides ratti]CEF61293.1 Asator [Strongyloides ratti]
MADQDDKTLPTDGTEKIGPITSISDVTFPVHEKENNGLIDIPPGILIEGKFQFIKFLDEGGCGTIFLVKDIASNAQYALKAVSNKIRENTILNFEVQVMKRLRNKRNVCQLISSGKNSRFSYVIMTLLGQSLFDLIIQQKFLSKSTSLRISIQCLLGIKQIHEVGFIHRDIKTENFLKGVGNERIIYLVDFGLVREYVKFNSSNQLEQRKARIKCAFRGTTKYASINAHENQEQGRSDDLISLLYCTAEFQRKLPWDFDDTDKVKSVKKETSPETIFPDLPELAACLVYLYGLSYYTRPDYHKIFTCYKNEMVKLGVSYDDPYDWELTKRQTVKSIRKKPVNVDNVTPNIENKKPCPSNRTHANGNVLKNRIAKAKRSIRKTSRRIKNSFRKKNNKTDEDSNLINDNELVEKSLEAEESARKKDTSPLSILSLDEIEQEFKRNIIGF